MSIRLTSTKRRVRNCTGKPFAIGFERLFAVDATRHVPPMRGRKDFLGHGLEVEHVERVSGSGERVLRGPR
jgi:hypothetical protein